MPRGRRRAVCERKDQPTRRGCAPKDLTHALTMPSLTLSTPASSCTIPLSSSNRLINCSSLVVGSAAAAAVGGLSLLNLSSSCAFLLATT